MTVADILRAKATEYRAQAEEHGGLIARDYAVIAITLAELADALERAEDREAA